MKLQAVNDSATEQNFRQIERAFPIQRADLADDSVGSDQIADSAKELFLQLVTAGVRKVDLNVTAINIAAQGGYTTIDHFLGTTPKVVIPVVNGGTFQINVSADEYSATTFRLGAYRTDGPNVGTQNIAWVALG